MKYQTMFLSALLAVPSLYCQNESDLPKLSLRIGKSIADEYGNAPGSFIFERTGSTDEPLAFLFTLIGNENCEDDFAPNANPGKDYKVGHMSTIEIPLDDCIGTIAGGMSFEAGSRQNELFIIPLLDDLEEADEEVTVRLEPSIGFEIEGNDTASATFSNTLCSRILKAVSRQLSLIYVRCIFSENIF